MKSIGIDISKNGIAIVEATADRSGYQILNGDFYPLNPNDPGNWEMDMLQGLKSLGQVFDYEGSSVNISMSQQLISTRNLNFPFTRRLDIQKSLPFELEDELPLGIDDGILDSKIVAQSASETSLLAFAAPKNEVIALLEVLHKVNIDPDLVGAEGAAFANLFEDWANGSFLMSPPETIPTPLEMKIFFRHDNTLLTLFQGRQMIWTRSISWGERNIIMEMMKTYNYPYDQAASLLPEQTKMLVMMAGADAEAVKMASLLEKSLREFARQLKLSFIDIEDRFKTTVGNVNMLGSIAFIDNITAYFTKSFGIPFNSQSLENEVFRPRQVEAIAHFVNRAPIAIGIALEAFKRPRNPAVNFRQAEAAKTNLFWEKTWTKWGQAIALCAVAYVAYIGYGVVREQIAVQLDTVTYETLQKSAGAIAGLKGAQATPDRIERYLNEENEKAEKAKLFEKVKDLEPAMKVVSQLSTVLPSSKMNSYDVRRVDVKNAQVVIEGEAKSRATVDLIRKKLEGLSSDKKIHTVTPTFGPAKGVTFAFRFTAKG